MRFLSLGAGVQSSTIALMIEHGVIDNVDAAIFADTQWEPKAVYDWLDYLETKITKFPIYRVTKGSLRESVMRSVTKDGRYVSIPAFIVQPNGDKGIGRRQCTREFKLEPILKKKRELLGYEPRQRIPAGSCESLIGISLDEQQRARPSTESWNTNVYPLLDLGMTRWDCMLWLDKMGYPQPPKSSCIGCPFHGDAEWRKIKNDPVAWADAVELDEALRNASDMKGKQFLHRSCVPLKDVDLSTEEEHGQLNLFKLECLGLCGN